MSSPNDWPQPCSAFTMHRAEGFQSDSFDSRTTRYAKGCEIEFGASSNSDSNPLSYDGVAICYRRERRRLLCSHSPEQTFSLDYPEYGLQSTSESCSAVIVVARSYKAYSEIADRGPRASG